MAYLGLWLGEGPLRAGNKKAARRRLGGALSPKLKESLMLGKASPTMKWQASAGLVEVVERRQPEWVGSSNQGPATILGS